MTALPPWTLPQFEQHVEIALETMAQEGVVSTQGQRVSKSFVSLNLRREARQTREKSPPLAALTPEFPMVFDMRWPCVSTDPAGKPNYRRLTPSQGEDGTLRIEMAADLTPIGLPSAVPIIAATEGAGPVVWSMGKVPIATIPGEWTPEEDGEAIGRNRLRAAYRQWLVPGRGGEQAR